MAAPAGSATATAGTGATVTWSFADNPQLTSTRYAGYRTFDSTVSGTYRQLVEKAVEAWEAVANIDLVQVADSVASNIRIGNR